MLNHMELDFAASIAHSTIFLVHHSIKANGLEKTLEDLRKVCTADSGVVRDQLSGAYIELLDLLQVKDKQIITRLEKEED